ncbi:RICIN domain-containing protein [Nonomuraea cavernae]|uniref:RICIN domain-containing protein n=1 Tax=Nonomuraea cavernae TaxID=2045107 RepID=UPI0033CA31C8
MSVHIRRLMAFLAVLVMAAASPLAGQAFGWAGPAEARASAVPPNFVHREGKDLKLDGRPYRFVGFNAFGMTGCATGTAWTQAELDAYFSGLPPAAMTRTWAFEWFGVEALDRIVASAEAHGQKLIFSLANQGQDCGESDKDLAWYRTGYQGGYLSWVTTVVSRFKDSPAIGMWELINEPGNGLALDVTTLKNFFDATAAAIKRIDPHHLVETGTMAEYAHPDKYTNYAILHSGPDIDVGSLHEYDQDHSDQIVSRHLAPTMTPVYKLNKPFIIGEAGIVAGPGCAISLATRATMFKREFDGDFLSGAAGVLIWTYSPNARSVDPAQQCMHQVRLPDSDPTIAMVRNYIAPATVTAPTGPRAIKLRGVANGCLDVPSSSTSDGTVIQLYTCNNTGAQRFTFQPATDGFYRILNQTSGKCLDVGGKLDELNAPVRQMTCASTLVAAPNQQFRLEPTDSGYYRVIPRHSIMCFRMKDGSTAIRTQLTQYDCKTPLLMTQQYAIG